MNPSSSPTQDQHSVVLHYKGQAKWQIPRNVTHVIVDPSVTDIPKQTFRNCQRLVSIQMPQQQHGTTTTGLLKSIAEAAFELCSSLQEISIPSSVETIGLNAFRHCEILVRVDIVVSEEDQSQHDDDAIETNNNTPPVSRLNYIGGGAFGSCKALTHIRIPSSVETMEASTFRHCQSLGCPQLSEGLKVIDAFAFGPCLLLKSFNSSNTLPSSVETIGKSAFRWCSELEELNLKEDSQLQAIHDFAFDSCSNLKTISMPSPSKLVAIGSNSFRYCHSLVSLKLPEGLVMLGNFTFAICSSLVKVSLPSSLQSIGDFCFNGCGALVEVDLHPDGSLKVICPHAFYRCASLRSIAIPKSVYSVGETAFGECSSLTSVILQPGIRAQLGPECFRDCVELVNIAIPSSMEQMEIPPSAFWRCTLLRTQYRSNGKIVPGLRKRLNGFPMHQLCHDAVFEDVDETKTKMESLLAQEPNVTLENATDDFGMTPFHILAMSPHVHVELFAYLMNVYPIHFLSNKNGQGKRPMDYLSTHASPECIPLILKILERTVLHRLHSWNQPHWYAKMCTRVESLAAHVTDEDSLVEQTRLQVTLDEMNRQMQRYERIEGMTQLELALWKHQWNLFLKDVKDDRLEEDPLTILRSTCRMTCGAEVVISVVKQFLFNC